MRFELPERRIIGSAGDLLVLPNDEIAQRFLMLVEGQCEGLGAVAAAKKYNISKQRYFQVLRIYREDGAAALQSRKRGPKTNYVRTGELVRQVIRHRFLDPDASVDVIAQKIRQSGLRVSTRSVERVVEEFGLQKKLYSYRPYPEQSIETHPSRKRITPLPCDPLSLERGVRQLLADKVMGNLAGLWLLTPELMRLGAWDLLCGWTKQGPGSIAPRLALQLIHESALCVTGVRAARSLNQRTFTLVNGLPFLATDGAVHALLDERSVIQSQRLQVALGKLRRASGHLPGRVLAIDPHRMRSYSKRHMQRRRDDEVSRPTKVAQTFFVLDVDSGQPVCFTTATSARTATEAAKELLELSAAILNPQPGQTLVVADAEHFTAELLDHVKVRTNFDLLVPMSNQSSLLQKLRALPQETFVRRWAGYATAKLPYTPTHSQSGPFSQYVQRTGERAEQYHFKAFLSTRDGDEVEALTGDYPKRWHVEEFFNANQALGWDRAGTCNLNIRYAQMTMGLFAQAAIQQFRERISVAEQNWDAKHLAKAYFSGLEGDVRVQEQTIVVTYYNAPDADRLRPEYEGLPDKLSAEGIDPRVPWLYGFQLDFRFR
jgi:transposase